MVTRRQILTGIAATPIAICTADLLDLAGEPVKPSLGHNDLRCLPERGGDMNIWHVLDDKIQMKRSTVGGVVTYEYFGNFIQYDLKEASCRSITRLWANDLLIWQEGNWVIDPAALPAGMDFRNVEQGPHDAINWFEDWKLERVHIVMADLPLIYFGNRIPNLTTELL